MVDSILVDLSKHQGPDVPFDDLAAAGIIGSIDKCTHGIYGTDPTFVGNWRRSKAAGLARGAYLWLVPEQDPVVQVDHALDVIDRAGGLDDKDFTVSIDFEQETTITGQRLIDIGERAVIRACEQTKRRVVQFYSGRWYWVQYCLDIDSALIAAQDYWHAEYPSLQRGLTYAAALRALGSPHLAKPWASRGILETLHQFDGTGGLLLPNGVDADFNRFRGSRSDLDHHIAGTLLQRPTEHGPSFPDGPANPLGYADRAERDAEEESDPKKRTTLVSELLTTDSNEPKG